MDRGSSQPGYNFQLLITVYDSVPSSWDSIQCFLVGLKETLNDTCSLHLAQILSNSLDIYIRRDIAICGASVPYCAYILAAPVRESPTAVAESQVL